MLELDVALAGVGMWLAINDGDGVQEGLMEWAWECRMKNLKRALTKKGTNQAWESYCPSLREQSVWAFAFLYDLN